LTGLWIVGFGEAVEKYHLVLPIYPVGVPVPAFDENIPLPSRLPYPCVVLHASLQST
jgi:hypothetical protein